MSAKPTETWGWQVERAQALLDCGYLGGEYEVRMVQTPRHAVLTRMLDRVRVELGDQQQSGQIGRIRAWEQQGPHRVSKLE